MGRKTKWSVILNQQVQDLSGKNVFSQTDLMWNEIRRLDKSVDRVALIPYSRLPDFIKGEEMNPDAPCKFIRRQMRSHEVLDNSSLRISSSNVYAVYHCSYGPEDNRIRSEPTKRKRRQNIRKRGCGCHFIVKQLVARPGVAIITYNLYVHEDKNGWPCHGILDRSGDPRARNAPRLPVEMVLSVEAMYNLGLPINVVYEQHILEVAEGRYDICLKNNRDSHLMRRDIINICNRLVKTKFQLHKNDSTSVNLWYQREQKSFFFFQRPEAEDMPFIIGIQTEWMLHKMVEHSNNSFIAMDSTFRTNKYGYQLYTLLVFDTQQNALPVAWVVSSQNRFSDISRWLSALMDRGRQVQPTWTINAFMIDDALVEIGAISAITGSRVLLCVWHFRRALLKNVYKLATYGENARKMFTKLGEIMNACNDTHSISQAMNAFYIDFAAEERFLDYFSANWMVNKKFYVWAECYINFCHANQETNCSIESYHCFLKRKYLCDRRKKSLQRMDWLTFTLLKRVELCYWNMACLKNSSFVNNYRLEHMYETSVDKAKRIPEDHCVQHEHIQSAYWVQSQSSSNRYLVLFLGQTFSSCNCPWALRGNFCKHVIKVSTLCGDVQDSKEITNLCRQDIKFDCPNNVSNLMVSNNGIEEDSVVNDNDENVKQNSADIEDDDSDGGNRDQIFEECNKKLQMVMAQPPRNLSKALLLKDLVDKLVKDVNENCIMDFDFINDGNEHTSKRRKSFLYS